MTSGLPASNSASSGALRRAQASDLPGLLPGTLFSLGLAHQHLADDLRECIALDDAAASLLRSHLKGDRHLSEFLLLSTCNRLEVYGVTLEPDALARTAHWLAQAVGRDADSLSAAWRRTEEVAAAAHLFAVASGLESQLLGETEILGQVKDAYDLAGREATVGPRLHRLLQKTFQAAKLVRSETGIARGQVSIGNVAVDLAARIFGDLTRARLLIVGSGEVGELTAKAFRSRGATGLRVTSRNPETAARLAASVDASPVPFDQWQNLLPECDVIVTATASPTPVLSRQAVEAALSLRAGRPLFLIDLAVPRDIESGVGELEDAYVYTLEDLAEIARDNLAARRVELGRAREIIATRAEAAVRRK